MTHLKYFLFTLLFFRLGNTSENVRSTTVAHNQTVFQRGLCVKNATKVDILNNYNSHYAHKNNTRIMTNILGFFDTVSTLKPTFLFYFIKSFFFFVAKYQQLFRSNQICL